MNRRQFISLSGAAGLAAITSPTSAAEVNSGRDYYEVRKYLLENDGQKQRVDAFLKEAAIPAVNRLGIRPVGVFYPHPQAPANQTGVVWAILRHPSAQSVATLTERLAEDSEFLSAGADYIDATADSPAYKRIESSLLIAFTTVPRLETPVNTDNPDRVFQLRTYESPSEKTNLKKIEMFEKAGEIRIFREVGLNPVFYGRAVVGAKLPNLTYMLGFKNMDEEQAAWKRFGAHPDWKRLSRMPEYMDKNILCGITNRPLVPAQYSQI